PDAALLENLLEEIVNPIALRMSLPNAVTHRIKQALAIVGKLSHRPDNRIATRRLVFREAFPAALELFELRAMATGRGGELVGEWAALLARVQRARAAFEKETGMPAAPAPARKRRRGGRRRRS